MTTATFTSAQNRLVALSMEGHAGLADAGGDILCAALTSALRLTECAVNDVLGLEVPVRLRPGDAAVSLKLPKNLGAESDALCQTLLSALLLYFVQLAEEYPGHLLVLEEDSE